MGNCTIIAQIAHWEIKPAHTSKHICNSHKPALKPKIAKELACLPPLFCRPEKQNQDSTKLKIK